MFLFLQTDANLKKRKKFNQIYFFSFSAQSGKIYPLKAVIAVVQVIKKQLTTCIDNFSQIGIDYGL